jgi:hypothetical protein
MHKPPPLATAVAIILFGLAGPQPAAAQAPAGDAAAAAAVLVDGSDRGAALQQLGTPIDQVVETLASEAPHRVPDFRALWREQFAAARLRQEFISRLASAAPADSLIAAAGWLRQPVVSRPMELLREARSRDGYASFRTWMEDLDEDTVDDARLYQMDQIIERMGPERTLALPLARLAVGLRVAYEMTDAEERGELRLAVEQLAYAPQFFASHLLVVERLFLYHALSDLDAEELAAFADQVGSSEGQWYHRTVFGVQEDILADAALRAVAAARS